MRKLWNRLLICILAVISFTVGSFIADRHQLREALIRFHVVANSDSEEDQAIKLKVRDAVLRSLEADLSKLTDAECAKAYLRENLIKIEEVANRVLMEEGGDFRATVSLCKEAFGTRVYDTFTLPSGVYESLRIKIGEARGKNWWCVVFPSFCMPAASDHFADVAAGAGFSGDLIQALEGESEYKIRFYLLDLLGRMENIFFAGDI